MELKINKNQTDTRLIQILEKLEVIITSEEGEEHKKGLTVEEIANLKIAEEVILEFSPLNSNTKYKVNVVATSKQGSVEETVETKQDIEEIKTLKTPAKVQIKNQFVIRRYDRF